MDEGHATRISSFLDLRAAVRRADIAFVFGTKLVDPISIAADLLERKVVRYVVLTGGANPHTGVNEARTHQALLLKRGVPAERLIVEDGSRSTQQNVAFALPKMEEYGLSEASSIVAVTKWYHTRRAVMTLKHHLPPGVRYYTESYEPEGCSRNNWLRRYDGFYGRESVLKE